MISVLLVDDEPGLLELGTIFLEKTGEFSIDAAPSAENALEMMESARYDAIASDYQMPGMDRVHTATPWPRRRELLTRSSGSLSPSGDRGRIRIRETPISMTFRPIAALPRQPGSFCMIVAPESTMVADLAALLLQVDRCAYLSGPRPHLRRMLTDVLPPAQTCTVLTLAQMRSGLAGAAASLVLVEHDPDLFESSPEFIDRIGLVFRRTAQNRGIRVVILATRMDEVLERMSGYCDKLVVVEHERGAKRPLRPGQVTLGG